MPTIITHAAVPLAIGIGLGTGIIPPRLLLAGVAASMLPDADVLGFHLGVPYGDALGHRGFSHSLFSAALTGACAMFAAPFFRSSRLAVFLFVAVCMASHGLLDMLTNGGMGVALLWPVSEQRFFFPWHGIAVSPLKLDRILSERGVAVALSELRWVWLPAAACALAAIALRLTLRPRPPAQ